MKFLMAGGGTGGHVIPALAVARVLRSRGHDVLFIGTRAGLEAKLVPAEGFAVEWIEIGGLKRVGLRRALRTALELPSSTNHVLRLLAQWRPAAVFSMGGYVAGPVMLAARLRRIPMILMEPNAMPGFTSRRMARVVKRALLSFPEAARFFPAGRSEVTGLPVRSEFFALAPKPAGRVLTMLVTGGSRGSRSLNRAVERSWALFRENKTPVRILHQTGADAFEGIAGRFRAAGLDGEVIPFINDMAGAFARADLVVCRSGAGAVAELAAAGKPAILVPFPFASDDHQLRNAEAFARAGAARLVLDRDFTGQRLSDEIAALASEPGSFTRMGDAARRLARPGAAERAAGLLEEVARANA